MNLLELFSTDRRLLDFRGSLIIRQLCLNLNTERIYRKFAEIIEKEEVCSTPAYVVWFWLILRQDLEFASVIVQKLNIILITSPELADFRKRLKSLETRVGLQSIYAIHSLVKLVFAARRPSSFYSAISIVVSQCCCGVFALPSRTSL
jgi:vacuole morphology and inheritance protein 14